MKTKLLKKFIFVLSCSLAGPAWAAAAWHPYVPDSRIFDCSIPEGWQAVENDESSQLSAHILGPDDPLGLYRTGIDVRRYEKGQSDYQPVAKALIEWRKTNKETDRALTAVRPMRISGSLAMTFEVTEKRWLPIEETPLSQQYLHRYVAIIPKGEDYYVVSLSSMRDVYLDYRDVFYDFLKSFHAL